MNEKERTAWEFFSKKFAPTDDQSRTRIIFLKCLHGLLDPKEAYSLSAQMHFQVAKKKYKNLTNK